MNVWIINPYGNIPGEGWRTYRTTFIADAFAAQGHQVTSWVSNIQHRSKEKRAEGWTTVHVNPNYQINIVPSVPYQKHISLARVRYERTYAKNLRDRVLEQGAAAFPDLIILGEPALFISDLILDLVKRLKCKLMVDVIDLWPELFGILVPKAFNFIFFPFYQRRKRLFKKADALIAVAEDYLAIARRANARVPHAVVYWGVELAELKGVLAPSFSSVLLRLLHKAPGDIWVIYAGTLGPNYDIKTIVACGHLLAERAPHIKLIVAGDGPLKHLLKSPLLYVGSLSSADVSLLYTQCDLALSSYVSGSTVSMPIKAYDYLASGLPLVNSLGRDLGQFVLQEQVGLPYVAEDAESMCAAVLTLASDVKLREQMRQNALALADRFDAKVQYKKVVEVAEEIWRP